MKMVAVTCIKSRTASTASWMVRYSPEPSAATVRRMGTKKVSFFAGSWAAGGGATWAYKAEVASSRPLVSSEGRKSMENVS
jgi:hypothetical protein